MKYGISLLSVVPGRAEPSDRSEMATQLLFGDAYKVTEERSKWLRIRLLYDKYECWIDRKQFVELSEREFDQIESSKSIISVGDMAALIYPPDGAAIPVLLGASLPGFTNGFLEIGGTKYRYDGAFAESSAQPIKQLVCDYAMLYLNAPYLWGGRSPFGIDCSGLSQMTYKLAGKKLPRDAFQQAEIGTTLSFVEESVPGDLAFFDDHEGNIIHVGILLGNNKIVHASGRVRMDHIDHFGIYNPQMRDYSHKLRLIKKVI